MKWIKDLNTRVDIIENQDDQKNNNVENLIAEVFDSSWMVVNPGGFIKNQFHEVIINVAHHKEQNNCPEEGEENKNQRNGKNLENVGK